MVEHGVTFRLTFWCAANPINTVSENGSFIFVRRQRKQNFQNISAVCTIKKIHKCKKFFLPTESCRVEFGAQNKHVHLAQIITDQTRCLHMLKIKPVWKWHKTLNSFVPKHSWCCSDVYCFHQHIDRVWKSGACSCLSLLSYYRIKPIRIEPNSIPFSQPSKTTKHFTTAQSISGKKPITVKSEISHRR